MTKKSTRPILIIGGAHDADILYASRFAAVDPIVMLDDGTTVSLVVPLMEAGRARRGGKNVEVWTTEDLKLSRKHRRRISMWALALLRKKKIRQVTVPPSFPSGALRRLERSGIRIKILDKSAYPQRAIKSRKEIDSIRGVQAAAVAAVRRAMKRVARSKISHDGFLMDHGKKLTSHDVRTEIEMELLQHGCNGPETIVAGGAQGADPHERGSGPLHAGQPIVIDIFPRNKSHGYWGDITRTILRGKTPPEVRKMFAAVLKAQERALSMIKPGARCRTIHREVQRVLEKEGFETAMRGKTPCGFIHGTGHGVGLDIHEAPTLSLTDDVLRAGHVVTVEPGLYYPEWGGVRIEDTVVVTARGFKYLAECTKKLEV